MLDSLRKHAGGWVAKIFISLLVLSFAVWGVADIFSGYRSQSLATVGDTDISVEEFRFAFQNEMREASRQLGRSISLDQARALGLDGQVLGRMIGEATLDNDAREKKLGITTEAVARSIAQDPTFRDSFGNFSRFNFEQVLRSNGLSEAGYVTRQRELQMRLQIAGAVGASSGAPEVLIEAVHRFTEERRTIAYVVLTAAGLGPIPAPDEATLEAYFEANKGRFRAPELREIEIIAVAPAALRAKVEVPEADITAILELRGGSLSTPERREVQQIVFTSREEAKAAADKIAAGSVFLDIAKERGLSETDVSLGLVEKSGIVDQAVRDAAFALKEGEVSAPVAGRLGTVLVRVTKIEPAKEKPLAEVREEIRRELAVKKASERVLDLYDAIEDQRATGAPFSEIAGKLDLPYRRIAAIDAQGRDAAGAPVADLPAAQDVMQTAFETDPGVELDALQTVGGGFVWLNVLNVTEERDRSLDEVRGKVEEAWRAEKTGEQLAAKADELLERLKDGASLETIAREMGTPVTTTQPVKRGASDSDLSPAAIQTAFATPDQGLAASQHANGNDRVLMQVRGLELPDFDPSSAAGKRIIEGIDASLANSLLNDYVFAKQERFSVKINQQSLQTLLGEN
ncbi:MAG: SurA N-terminal domain-containing protein [Hyphomicrobiales bacterium]|nr:SurA N-terminal domain-containing protein [Hyphomicrobiales bacterium]